MNPIQILSAQPWVERLGTTLLHFLWQGILIATVYAAVRRWATRASGPNARYVLACAALAAMAIAPMLTWILLNPDSPDVVAATFRAPLSAAVPSAVRTVPASFSLGDDRAVRERFLPWIVAAWLGGAITFCVRLIGGWILAESLRSRLVRPAPSEWQLALDRLKASIRVSRPVRLLVSSLAQVPAVVGWLRPVILIPVGALAGLPPEQIEALILHELAHIRRHDYLVNVIQSAVEALLFYHPTVWWVSGHIRAERELCCDDVAVSVNRDALTYARALAEMESARSAHSRTALAATGGSLADRIGRLLGESRPQSRALSGPGLVAAAMLVAVSALALFGQPGARPKFEVASIKPSEERPRMMVRPIPGGLTANAPVRLLMENAYALQPFQIVGGPDWIDSELYRIDAKADADATRDQVLVMLQSLLEDRFQLKVHRETRELPVFSLVTAKNGPKLPSPKDGGCVEPPPDDVPEQLRAGGRMTPPDPGQPPLAPCGSVRVMLASTGARMQGGKVPMPEFIRMLSMVLGRTVADKTGLTGAFDVRLDFLPDETTEALPPPPPGAGLDSKTVSILVALQEQLGLRLESTKGPVEVIFIDGVERPSAN